MGFFKQIRQDRDYSGLRASVCVVLWVFIEIGFIVLIFFQALTVPWFEVFVAPELEYRQAEVREDSFCLLFTAQVRFVNVNDCRIDFSVLNKTANDPYRGRREFNFYACNDWRSVEGLSSVADEMCEILGGARLDLLHSRRLMIAALFFTFVALICFDLGAKSVYILLAAILALAGKLKLQTSDFGEDFELDGIITLIDNSTATIEFESNAKKYFVAPVILMWIYY
ncbi:MAG: hypothetical protein MI892_04465 [Desulfobacterales bacterium]|nr:hypothetical protein [Desulfobacterales bacterium]